MLTKRLKTIIAAALIALSAHPQGNSKTPAPFIPVGSVIDVESLNREIDTSMDISRLSLSDLRILRNAFAARQGYCFEDYALRAIFSHTTWYDSLLWVRMDGPLYDQPLKYTPGETAFIERIKKREAELRARNFTAPDGGRVNTDNIVNTFQLEELSPSLYRRLSRDGFAIVPRQGAQLFHCYENNDYHDFPNFITTDLHLQMVHIYFSSVLQELEKRQLKRKIDVIVSGLYDGIAATAVTTADEKTQQAADYAMAWLAVAGRLSGNGKLSVPEAYSRDITEEVERVMAGSDDFSPFLGYTDVYFMYSLFKPRGNYSRTPAMQQYFRTLMWIQHAPFCTSDRNRLRSLVLMADALNADSGVRRLLGSVTDVLSLLVGQPDGLSLLDVAEVLREDGYDVMLLMKDNRSLARLARRLDTESLRRMRIRPKEELSCREKICLMPQRYLYDSEVLQELVDVVTRPETLRGCPKGLDVMAAFGSQTARRILLDDYREQERWPLYTSKLDSVAALMPLLSRDTTVYNRWMDALTAMQQWSDPRQPYFMTTPQWAKKNLNTSLASWAELKHDVMLYAKQPMAAECGGVIPDPVVVGYVEPNVGYWRRALSLVRLVETVLRRHNMMTPRLAALTEQVEEQTAFLLDISEKELDGRKLTAEEFRSIEKLGSTYEWLTLDIMKEKASESGMVWEDVQGPDKRVAVVADVYTANASNNPDKGILHEAVGTVDDIFVVVEINGLLHLTRGAVFSYREFRLPPGNRLTDEQWQKMLDEAPRYGVPEWMEEITLPDSVPADNELIFYSSGC